MTWVEEIAFQRENSIDHRVLTWPDEELPETGTAVLYVRVTTPGDQAHLHRSLARIGYIPELIANDGHDLWRFVHPDGARPCLP